MRLQNVSSAPKNGRTMNVMSRLVSQVHCYPYRLLTGDSMVVRAKVELNLSRFQASADRSQRTETVNALNRTVLVDLFDETQPVRLREEIRRRGPTMKQRDLARDLGVKQPVITNANRLNRHLQEAGRTDPFVPVRSPQEAGTRYRRHRHQRFRHSPLPGYEHPHPPPD